MPASAISYSETFSIRKLKIAIISFLLIHVLQKADMQMKCGFLVPTFSFWKFLISAWSLRYCRNLTFWKYSAEYWLNLICSRPKLCACVQCAVQPQGSFDILDIFTELLPIQPILRSSIINEAIRIELALVLLTHDCAFERKKKQSNTAVRNLFGK